MNLLAYLYIPTRCLLMLVTYLGSKVPILILYATSSVYSVRYMYPTC